MPQQIGFQAVIDLSKFTPAEQAFLKGIQAATAAVQQAAAQSATAARAFDSATNNILKQAQAFDAMGRSAQTMGSNVQAGIGLAFGQQIVSFAQSAVSGLENIIQKGYEVVSFYESLQFSIGSLVANEQRHADSTLSVADALSRGDVAAQKYLHTIQNLAILSPFNVDTLAAGFKLQQVYGFLADEAMTITSIITDWGSAANVTNEVMERVFLAVGQVKSETRLLSREILQLSQAGVPVRQILMDAFDISADELSSRIRKGLVSASDALEPIMKWMQEFEGSGKRASNTLRGLVTSLQDIQEIAERNIFAGIFEPLKPYLQMLVQVGLSDQFRATMVALGDEIGNLTGPVYAALAGMLISIQRWFAALSPEVLKAAAAFVIIGGALTALIGAAGLLGVAISAIINPFTLLVGAMAGVATAWVSDWNDIRSTTESALSALSSGFADLASAAADWGAAVVEAFASGMSSAVSIVADAMNAIGAMLTFWLAPGSPPRIVPDLDKWGKEAADVYLQGWTMADFGALDEVGNQIEKLLNAWGSAQGKNQKNQVPGMMQNLRPLIAQAVDEYNQLGTVTEGTFQRISAAAGVAGEEVGRLLQLQLRYATASEVVEAAQRKLNDLTKLYDDQLTKLNATLKMYQAQQGKVDNTKELERLNRVIASVYTSEGAKVKARARIGEILTQEKIDQLSQEKDTALSAAQTELTAAQTISEELKAQLDLYNARLNVETQTFGMLTKIENQQKETRQAAEKAAKKQLTDLEKQLEAIRIQQDEVKDTVALAKARAVLDDATSTEIEKQNALLTIQEITLKRMQREGKAQELGIFDQIPWEKLRSLPVTLEDMGIKAKGAAGGISELGDSLTNFKKIDVDAPFKKFQETLAAVREQFAANKKAFNDWIDSIDAVLPPFLKIRSAAYYMGKEIDSGTLSFNEMRLRAQAMTAPLMQVVPIFETLKTVFEGLAAAFVTTKLINVLRALPALFTTGAGAAGLIGLAVGALAIAWQLNLGDIQQHTAAFVAFVQAEFAKLPATIAGLQAQFAALAAAPAFTAFLDAMRKFGTDLGALWTTLFSENLTSEALDKALMAVGFDLSAFFVSIGNLVSLAGAFIGQRFTTEWLPAFTTWVNNVWPRVSVVLTALLNLWWNWIKAGGVLIGAGFVLSWLPAFTSWAANLWTTISPTLLTLLANIGTWLATSATTVAGQFTTVWLPAFTAWISNLWTTWAPLLGGAALAVLGWIATSASVLATAFTTIWLPAFIDWAIKVWPGVQTGLTTFLSSVATWIADSTGTISDKLLLEWIPAFTNWVANTYLPLAMQLAGFILRFTTWIVATGIGLAATVLSVWVPAMVNWAQDIWPKLAPKLAAALIQIWAWISTNAVTLTQKLRDEWLPAFTGWLTGIWASLQPQLVALLVQISNWIVISGLALYAKVTTEWLPAFVDWALTVWTSLQTNLATLLTSITGWITTTASTLSTQITTEWLPALSDWLPQAVPQTTQKLGQWYSAFGVALSGIAANIGTKVTTEWLPALSSWISEAVVPALAALASWLGSLVSWIALQGLPLLLAGVLDLGTALVDWIGQAAIIALPKLGTFFGDIIAYISTKAVPMVLGGVLELGFAILSWLAQAKLLSPGKMLDFFGAIISWIGDTGIPSLTKAVADLVTVAISWVAGGVQGVAQSDSAWGKVGESFKKFLAKVQEVITNDVVPGLITGAQNMVTAIMDGLAELWSPANIKKIGDEALKIGTSVIDGIKKGVEDNFEGLKKSFTDTVGGAMDAAKAFLGIKSPSTKAADEIGAPLAQGINSGIESVPLDALGKAIAKELVKALAELEAATPKTMQNITSQTLTVLNTFVANMIASFTVLTVTTLALLATWEVAATAVFTLFTTTAGSLGITFLTTYSLALQAFYMTSLAALGVYIATFTQLVTAWLAAMLLALQTFLATVMTNAQTFQLAYIALWTSIRDTVITLTQQMRDSVIQTFNEMYTGIENIVKTIPDLVMKWLGDKKPGLIAVLKEDFVPKGEEVGNAFVDGIINGIQEKVDDLEEAARDAVDDAVSAAKTALAAASPSKRTAQELGAPFVQGIAVGVAQETDTLERAVSNALGQAADVPVPALNIAFTLTGIDALTRLGPTLAAALQQALADANTLIASYAFELGRSIGANIAAGIASVNLATTLAGGTPMQQLQTVTGAVPAYGAGTVNNYNYVRNYNLTLNTDRSANGVAREFALMEIVAM